jgi:hypothetical protein
MDNTDIIASWTFLALDPNPWTISSRDRAVVVRINDLVPAVQDETIKQETKKRIAAERIALKKVGKWGHAIDFIAHLEALL